MRTFNGILLGMVGMFTIYGYLRWDDLNKSSIAGLSVFTILWCIWLFISIFSEQDNA